MIVAHRVSVTEGEIPLFTPMSAFWFLNGIVHRQLPLAVRSFLLSPF